MSHTTGMPMPAPRFWRAVQALPLWGKLALALLSGGSYWLINELGERFDWDHTIFGDFAWLSPLVAVIFGALVMAPHAAASRMRWLRIPAMCVASAFIYFFAVKFVANGPLSYNTLAPYLISGAAAALLVGLSVVLLAPGRASWRLFVLCLVAGLVGGAAFWGNFWPELDDGTLFGHLLWQVLVCLALHLGLRSARS